MILKSFCSLWKTVVATNPMRMQTTVVENQFLNSFHQLRGQGLRYIGRYPLGLDASRTLWFGKDAFGRRSLLVHWPTSEDSRFGWSSVSPPASTSQRPDLEVESRDGNLSYWEELPCGVYSVVIHGTKTGACLAGKVRKHEWTDSMLKDLVKWERKLIAPKHVELTSSNSLVLSGSPDLVSASDDGTLQSSIISPADRVLGCWLP